MRHRNCQAVVFDIYEMLGNREVPIQLEEGKRPADSQKSKQAAEEKQQTYFTFTYLWENIRKTYV